MVLWSWPRGKGAEQRRGGWQRRLMREMEDGYVILLWWRLGLDADPAEFECAVAAGRVLRRHGGGFVCTGGGTAAPMMRQMACDDAWEFASYPVSTGRAAAPSSSLHTGALDPVAVVSSSSSKRLSNIVTVHCCVLSSQGWLETHSARRHASDAPLTASGVSPSSHSSLVPIHVGARVAGMALEAYRSRQHMAPPAAGPSDAMAEYDEEARGLHPSPFAVSRMVRARGPKGVLPRRR